MLRFKKIGLNSSGDTIIEVMVVLAILSLAFGISLTTANEGLKQSRNSQEHSQADGLASSQIEELRSAIETNSIQLSQIPANQPFCMTSSNAIATNFSANVPADPTADDYSEYPAGCASQESYYNESIEYVTDAADATQNYFDVKVRWQGLGDLGKQQVELTYKLYELAPNSGSGVITSASSPQIKVVVRKMTPAASYPSPTIPSCSSPSSSNTTDEAGTTVAMQDTTDGDSLTPQTTDGTSTTEFQNLTGYHSYSANIASPPAGYQSCPGYSSGSVASLNPTTNPEIDMYITPVCNIAETEYNSVVQEIPYAHYVEEPVWWWDHGGGTDPEYDYETSHLYNSTTDIVYAPVGQTTGDLGPYISPDPAGQIAYQFIAHDPSDPEPNWFYNTFTSEVSWQLTYTGTYADPPGTEGIYGVTYDIVNEPYTVYTCPS